MVLTPKSSVLQVTAQVRNCDSAPTGPTDSGNNHMCLANTKVSNPRPEVSSWSLLGSQVASKAASVLTDIPACPSSHFWKALISTSCCFCCLSAPTQAEVGHSPQPCPENFRKLSRGSQSCMHVNLNHFPGAGSMGYLRVYQCRTNLNPLHRSGFEDNVTISPLREIVELQLPMRAGNQKVHCSPAQAPTYTVLCVRASLMPADVLVHVSRWWL